MPQPQIIDRAFYRNSLSLSRQETNGVAIAQGHYLTRYGTVHLYGENYGPAPARKPHFSFDFTHSGRTYSCHFREWLSDTTIRLRANRFVSQCLSLPAPSPFNQ